MVAIAKALGLLALAAVVVVDQTHAAFQSCPTAPAKPEDRRVDTTKLKYATYNMEFLMLAGYGSSPKCPGASCPWANVEEATKHLKQVAKTVKAMDADIIQVNEVEDCAVLTLLIAEVAALGDATYKPYLIRGTDTATGQNSAIITRVDPVADMQRSSVAAKLPVANSKCPANAKVTTAQKSVSKHFYTTFQLAGFAKPITVIGAHLLAQPQNLDRCHEREGQATVLAGIAAEAMAKGHEVILSGDLNDFSLQAPDKNNNVPITNVLGILENSEYVNVGSLVPQSERFSQWWDKDSNCVFEETEVSSLDHVIVSKGLKDRITDVSFRHDLYYPPMCNGYNSDHYPIMFTLLVAGVSPVPTSATPVTPVPTSVEPVPVTPSPTTVAPVTPAPTAKPVFQSCPTAPAKPEDRRVDTTKLKYATYNMEFLMLAGYGSSPKCPGASCPWANVEEATKHLKQVAKTVKAMDADIIQVNEVEDCAVLTLLIAEVAALGDATYKPYLIRGTDTATGQNSAIITRVDPVADMQRSSVAAKLPVANSKCPANAKVTTAQKSVSKHFYTTFQLAGFAKPITVIGAHLLAQPQNLDRCHEREGQATVLAGIAAEAMAKGHEVILSGDLNDFSLQAPDKNNNVPITNVLGILENSEYVNVGSLVPQSERFSQWWDKDSNCVFEETEVSSLDHVIVSKGLKDRITDVSFRHDLYYPPMCNGYNSDHYPIMFTLLVAGVSPVPTSATPVTPVPTSVEPVPVTPSPTTVAPVTPAPTAKPVFQSCPTAPAKPEDRRVDTTKLKYATYNMEFLMLAGYGSSPKCPGASCPWANVEEATKHLKQVAKTVKAMDADIIQVNEVEDCAVLTLLIAEVAALGDATYKPYLIRGTDTATGQNSAIITRVDPVADMQRSSVAAKLPVANSKCPANAKVTTAQKSVSKHFYTTFQLAGFAKPITVIGAHLLAQPQNLDRCHEREGQATVLAGIAAEAMAKGHEVILSGDLNDFSLQAPDKNNNVPITNVLGILENSEYVNVGSLVPQSERFSQWWDKDSNCVFEETEVSSLDHVIVSKGLKDRITDVSFRHDLYYPPMCNGYNSDHYPIMFTLLVAGVSPVPTSATPVTPVPTSEAPVPVTTCSATLLASLIYSNPEFIKCATESGFPFATVSSAPSKLQMDKLCASSTCKAAFQVAVDKNPTECVLPFGKLALRADLLDRVVSYCATGAVSTPAPTPESPTPAPIPLPTPNPMPTPGPAPTPITPFCSSTTLSPITKVTTELIKCATDSGYQFVPAARPTDAVLAKICASAACSTVFSMALGANAVECTVPLGGIQYRADLLDVVASSCQFSPVTPAPSTAEPTKPVPTTPAPITIEPTKPVPTTPMPTTAEPTKPVPTTPGPGAACGNAIAGPSTCLDGQYCQPWNPFYYQCRSIDAKCGSQLVDVDFYGDDITNLSVLLPELCCDKCRATNGCKAYTFINFNAEGKPMCYLKKGTGTKQPLAGAVSAIVEAPACAVSSGGQCGSDKEGVTCCPSGEYCQPWNPLYYQCRPAPQQCAAQEVGVDYSGDDIESVFGFLPWECCDKCAVTAGCKAYTFVNNNADGRTACYLKKGTGQKRVLVGAVSSTVLNPKPACSTPEYGSCGSSAGTTCCPFGFYCQAWNPTYYQCMAKPTKCSQQFTDTDFVGSDLATVYGVSPAECCDRCSTTSGCKAYTFVNANPGRPACYLKSSASGKTTLSGAVSGIVN